MAMASYQAHRGSPGCYLDAPAILECTGAWCQIRLLLEELEDHLAVLVRDRERLNAKLLLGLESLKAG